MTNWINFRLFPLALNSLNLTSSLPVNSDILRARSFFLLLCLAFLLNCFVAIASCVRTYGVRMYGFLGLPTLLISTVINFLFLQALRCLTLTSSLPVNSFLFLVRSLFLLCSLLPAVT